jgi:hypothetical protein
MMQYLEVGRCADNGAKGVALEVMQEVAGPLQKVMH